MTKPMSIVPNTENASQLSRPPSEPPTPSLALSGLDVMGLQAFFGNGDANAMADLVEHARGLAEGLAGPSRNDVRIRTLARATAITRIHMSALEKLLGDRLAAHDFVGAKAVERHLKGATDRLVRLLEQHRADSRVAPSNLLLIDNMTVVTGR